MCVQTAANTRTETAEARAQAAERDLVRANFSCCLYLARAHLLAHMLAHTRLHAHVCMLLSQCVVYVSPAQSRTRGYTAVTVHCVDIRTLALVWSFSALTCLCVLDHTVCISG